MFAPKATHHSANRCASCGDACHRGRPQNRAARCTRR